MNLYNQTDDHEFKNTLQEDDPFLLSPDSMNYLADLLPAFCSDGNELFDSIPDIAPPTSDNSNVGDTYANNPFIEELTVQTQINNSVNDVPTCSDNVVPALQLHHEPMDITSGRSTGSRRKSKLIPILMDEDEDYLEKEEEKPVVLKTETHEPKAEVKKPKKKRIRPYTKKGKLHQENPDDHPVDSLKYRQIKRAQKEFKSREKKRNEVASIMKENADLKTLNKQNIELQKDKEQQTNELKRTIETLKQEINELKKKTKLLQEENIWKQEMIYAYEIRLDFKTILDEPLKPLSPKDPLLQDEAVPELDAGLGLLASCELEEQEHGVGIGPIHQSRHGP